MPRNVILVGASGLVGSQVLDLLLADKKIGQVCAPTRRPLEKKHEKLVNPVFSFDEFELHAEQLIDAEDLYFCYGSTLKKAGSKMAFVRLELDQSERIINVCLRKGVKRLLMVSASGASSKSMVFYNRIKGQLEDFAQGLLEQKKISDLVIARPSLLLGQRMESRPAEAFFRGMSKPFLFAFFGPLRSIRPVWDWQVARSLAKSSQEGTGHGLKILGNEVICEEKR